MSRGHPKQPKDILPPVSCATAIRTPQISQVIGHLLLGGRIQPLHLAKYILLLMMTNWVINLLTPVLQRARVPWLLFSHHISGSYNYLPQEMLIIIHLTEQLYFKGQGIYLPISSVSLILCRASSKEVQYLYQVQAT